MRSRHSILTLTFLSSHKPASRSSKKATHKRCATEAEVCVDMSFLRSHETGMQPATPPSRRDRDLTNSTGTRTLFKGQAKTHQPNGNRDTHPLGSPRYMPLSEHVNGLKNRPHLNQAQPRSDKRHQDIHAPRETLAPRNGALSTPDKTRPMANGTSTPLTTPSKLRTKRKRVGTVETSDSEDLVTLTEEYGRTATTSAHDSQPSRREDRRPNGTAMGRQDSGLFAPKPLTRSSRLTEEEFDSVIYNQSAAPTAPLGSLFDRRGPTRPWKEPSASNHSTHQAVPCLHIRMDPRIHWTHRQSEEWHRKKQKEIRLRGTRKENFGKAARRMQAKRISKALVSRAVTGDTVRNDSRVFGVGRPIDFGDVPEEELPEMVKSNPQWLKAAAWMRKCRQKSLEMQRGAEGRKKTGLPWKPLLGASGIR